MKNIFAAVLALIMGLSPVAATDGLLVGTDVAKADITDFYYTVDASTYPPHYQRYRFYVEDGKKWFFHESRQGGGWPQTEEDTVASGTCHHDAVDLVAYLCYRPCKVLVKCKEGNQGSKSENRAVKAAEIPSCKG